MILSPRWGLGTIRWIWCWLLLVTLLVAQCSRADVLRPPARIPGPQSRPSASSSTSSSSSSSSTTTSSSSSSSNRNMKPNPTRFQRQPLQPTGMGLPGLHHQRPGYSPSNRNNPGQQASILRLMTKTYLYLQILPNGTVSATGYESSYYCKSTLPTYIPYFFNPSNQIKCLFEFTFHQSFVVRVRFKYSNNSFRSELKKNRREIFYIFATSFDLT